MMPWALSWLQCGRCRATPWRYTWQAWTVPGDAEAARVDGGSEFQIYRYVDLPLLKPITVSAIVILGHIALRSLT